MDPALDFVMRLAVGAGLVGRALFGQARHWHLRIVLLFLDNGGFPWPSAALLTNHPWPQRPYPR